MRGLVTITPAPSIDLTYVLQRPLQPGEVQRAGHAGIELSGKGLNVAYAVAHTGVPVRAVLPVMPEGLAAVDTAAWGGMLVAAEPAPPLRINSSFVGSGAATKVNAPAPGLSERTWESIAEKTLARLDAGAGWAALCGT
ncbi:MAG: 1-phosphofructokinase, partial [Microbacterium sp.]